MRKAAFFEVEDWEREHISKNLKGFSPVFFSGKIDGASLRKVRDAEVLAVFIYSKVDKSVLDSLPKLKLIATMSTGFDHIDLEECRKRKIVVCNVPNYGENTVAEHTFALILALSRKIVESVDRTRKGDFSLEGLRGFDLKGKTIGIVGMGSIGQHVARMARGFEMDVLAFDLNRDSGLAKNLGFRYADMAKLLKNSDLVTLHCPYNKATHHLINKSNINSMKKGSILINTARGGLVETEALIGGLSSGQLAAAGLDVLEEECEIKEEKQLLSAGFAQTCDLRTVLQNHMLQRMGNVIITPHNAFNSREALLRILDTTVENVSGYARKKQVNVVK
ncbi:hydroxyacid dehydrogenase [Candidatus Woesearchaeota archaeon]|nr:hydroxyacid dehydrogenase [Candidatus Woesearchaeota archaeon]